MLTSPYNIVRYIIATTAILLIPLTAMAFTDEVAWTLSDFIIAGTLLLGTGVLYEVITRVLNNKYQVAVAIVLLGALFLIWAELALGLFGTPFAGS